MIGTDMILRPRSRLWYGTARPGGGARKAQRAVRARFTTMRFTMRTDVAWLAAASLIAVSCGGDIDCRHKDRECAAGFVCEESSANDWQCLPKEAAAGADGKGAPGKRANEGKVAPAPAPDPAAVGAAEPEGTICPEHPMCVGKSAKCFCGPDGNLLTRFLYDDKTGKPVEKAVYENDDKGRPVQVVVDEGMDGSGDTQHSYKYNDRGDPLSWQINRLTKVEGQKDQVVECARALCRLHCEIFPSR